jgi:hypothetical protein
LPKNLLDELSSPDCNVVATRRTLMLAALAAGFPLAASSKAAKASKLDPAETVITLPDAIKFVAWSGAPPHSGEMAALYSGLDKPGPYLVLMKWYPGYMSAPHSYSGADFDPNQTVPVPVGGFVRRVAHTPHYDGVKRDAKEPAVIALFGIGPVELTLVDPSKPGWRQV